MPAVSFVDKYGQPECEDLAYNMFLLFDSAVFGNSLAPFTEGGNRSTEGLADYGMYGTESILTVDGKQRVFGGVGAWPYVTQLSAVFTGQSTGGVPFTSSGGDPYATAITPRRTDLLYQDGGHREVGSRGFSPRSIQDSFSSNGPKPVNVEIDVTATVYYPPNFKNDFMTKSNGGGNFGVNLVDVVVGASGTYNGQPVTYGNGDPNYYYGFNDCAAVSGSIAGAFILPFTTDTNFFHGSSSGNNGITRGRSPSTSAPSTRARR